MSYENVCESDKLSGYYTNGIINIEKREEAHKFCQKCVEDQMKRREPNIIVANTFLYPLDSIFGIIPYTKLAIENNYFIQLLLPEYDLLHFKLPGTDGKTKEEIRELYK
jgi:hypothetical protein